jgi:hypothetical protein
MALVIQVSAGATLKEPMRLPASEKTFGGALGCTVAGAGGLKKARRSRLKFG